MQRFYSGAAIDRPETTKFAPIPEVVWQQPQETHSIHIHKNSTIDIKHKNDAEAQTSPIKETSFQVSGSDTELLLENQTRMMLTTKLVKDDFTNELYMPLSPQLS